MDKLRALSIYSKSLLRNYQGSGELLDCNHIFYEAEKLIRENGWEQEALEELNEAFKNVKDNYNYLEREYVEYLKSNKWTLEQEQYFNKCFNKLGVDDRAKIIAIYKAVNNGQEPSEVELKQLFSEQMEEDEQNAIVFIENQVKISNGEPFDSEKLLNSARYLKDRGLYHIALKNLELALSCYDAEELFADYKSYFKIFLY